VVGIPDEDIRSTVDVGLMVIIPGGGGGANTAGATGLSQRSPKSGAAEANDHFGYSLAA
jgi:hypothetical protein